MVGKSFWLWIGYDTEQKKHKYIMGENASDLYWNMHVQELFGEREPYFEKKLQNRGITLDEFRLLIGPDETWEHAEKKACLQALNTKEIVEIINQETDPTFRQIKLLEISTDYEKVFDYSIDRDRSKDDQLEASSDTEYKTTVIVRHKLDSFSVSGPVKMGNLLMSFLYEEGIIEQVDEDEIYFSLRYLHKGESIAYHYGNITIHIQAVPEEDQEES